MDHVRTLAKRLAEAHETHASVAFALLGMIDSDVPRETVKAACDKHAQAEHCLALAGKFLSHVVGYSDASLPELERALDAFDAAIKDIPCN